MKGTRHSEEQIIAILKRGAARLITAESPARDHGIDLLPLEGEVRRDGSGEAKRLRQLEDENRKLKHVPGPG